MKRQAGLTERISRRKFTQSVAGSLVAVPLVASLAEAQEGKGRGGSKTTQSRQTWPRGPQTKNEFDIFSQHDTPPPILFMEGSMIVEKNGDFDDVVTTGGRKKHMIEPDTSGQKLVPSHIKVIDGSGETLYRNLQANDCQITFTLTDGVVNAGSEPNGGPNNEKHFVIDTDSNKRLAKSSGADKPTGKKRDTRFRHKDSGGNERSIVSVKITEANVVLFNVVLAKLLSKGDELRVMVWLEQIL